VVGAFFFIKAKQGWTMQQHRLMATGAISNSQNPSDTRVVLAKFLNIGCSSAHHMDDTIISPKLKKKKEKNFIAQTTSCVLSPKKKRVNIVILHITKTLMHFYLDIHSLYNL
jgi:hypothetical protein